MPRRPAKKPASAGSSRPPPLPPTVLPPSTNINQFLEQFDSKLDDDTRTALSELHNKYPSIQAYIITPLLDSTPQYSKAVYPETPEHLPYKECLRSWVYSYDNPSDPSGNTVRTFNRFGPLLLLASSGGIVRDPNGNELERDETLMKEVFDYGMLNRQFRLPFNFSEDFFDGVIVEHLGKDDPRSKDLVTESVDSHESQVWIRAPFKQEEKKKKTPSAWCRVSTKDLEKMTKYLNEHASNIDTQAPRLDSEPIVPASSTIKSKKGSSKKEGKKGKGKRERSPTPPTSLPSLEWLDQDKRQYSKPISVIPWVRSAYDSSRALPSGSQIADCIRQNPHTWDSWYLKAVSAFNLTQSLDKYIGTHELDIEQKICGPDNSLRVLTFYLRSSNDRTLAAQSYGETTQQRRLVATVTWDLEEMRRPVSILSLSLKSKPSLVGERG